MNAVCFELSRDTFIDQIGVTQNDQTMNPFIASVAASSFSPALVIASLIANPSPAPGTRTGIISNYTNVGQDNAGVGSAFAYKTLTTITPTTAQMTTSTGGSVGGIGTLLTFVNVRPAANSLRAGLVSYWKCDEPLASDPMIDAHGSNNLAAVNNPNAFPAPFGIINGTRTLSLLQDMYFIRADNGSNSLSVGNTSYTLQAWVFIADKSQNGAIWSRYDYISPGGGIYPEFVLFYDSTIDRFHWYTYNSAVENTDTIAYNFGSPPVNTWLLVHAWVDRTIDQCGISVNAGQPNVTNGNGPLTPRTNINTRIGRLDSAGAWPLNARLDEYAFWKRMLTQPERTMLYNSGAGFPYGDFE
jgi:hypothetical protein